MKVAKTKVYVAMSGGVDSSVAAALLKKQGFNVAGVFFKPWSPPAGNYCNWEQDRRDAMKVATKLGIKFKTWDFSKEYEKEVVSYMIDSYRTGTTPNPDVMCNKEIKFGLFLKKSLAEGADYIATGHYARKREIASNNRKIKNYKLLKAKDLNKDQTYFLWTLTQKQLKYCLFPIGNYIKSDVRKLAKKFGLPNHDKKDSQGVCYVGQLNIKDFLKKYIRPKKGNIILTKTNKHIGEHDGAYFYTIGQRHGLDIKDGQGPYFVVSKNIKKNIIYVAKQTGDKELLSKNTQVTKLSWVSDKPKLPVKASIKIRYCSKSLPATITANSKGLAVSFKNPAKAVTPGQSAVIYRGEEVIGGGIISDR